MNASKFRKLWGSKYTSSRCWLIIAMIMISFVSAEYDFEFFLRVGKADYTHRGDDWTGTCTSGIENFLLSWINKNKILRYFIGIK